MKKEILNDIVEKLKKLISFKTTKDNLTEFDNAFKYIKEQLEGYFVREIMVDEYKNIIFSNTKGNDFDIIFCTHIDVVPAKEELYVAKELDGRVY